MTHLQWDKKLPLKHLFILLFIAIAYGSAFPVTKLALNDSVPPILMASLRMGIVLIILIPYWKFKIPEKKYLPSLVAFFSIDGSDGLCFYDTISFLFFYHITCYCWFTISYSIWSVAKCINDW